MNLAFYLGRQSDPITEGFIQLVKDLPSGNWACVKPMAAFGDPAFPSGALEEPDWYAWRKRPWVLFAMAEFFLRLRGMVVSKGVDRVFLYGIPSAWTFVLAFALLGTGARFVLFIHDPESHRGERFKQHAMNLLYERLMMRSALALVTSYGEGRTILGKRNVAPSERIHSLRLPMLNCMAGENGDGVASDILFFGRIEAYKGLHVLEEAIAILSERGLAPSVLLLGRGPLSDVAHRMGERFPNVRHIEEYVPNEALSSIVRATRIVVLPYLEATGTQIVQIANHHGIPVVATRVGCFPEYVLEGVNGTIVEPGKAEPLSNALAWWLEQDALVVSGRCRRYAAEHDSPQVFAARIDGILEGTREGAR